MGRTPDVASSRVALQVIITLSFQHVLESAASFNHLRRSSPTRRLSVSSAGMLESLHRHTQVESPPLHATVCGIQRDFGVNSTFVKEVLRSYASWSSTKDKFHLGEEYVSKMEAEFSRKSIRDYIEIEDLPSFHVGDTGLIRYHEWAPTTYYAHSTYHYKPMRVSPGYGVDFYNPRKVDAGFNQFLLENTMLAKWQKSGKCCEVTEQQCFDRAQVVILPSPILLFLELHKEYFWSNFWEDFDWSPQYRTYWDKLRERYFKPEEGYTPLLVMHTNFVWDLTFAKVLKTLSEQPREFVERIVIGTLEEPDPTLEEQMHSNLPRFVTLPYPTGLTGTARFTFQDQSGYDPARERPFAVVFLGDFGRGKHDEFRDGGNLVRYPLSQSLYSYKERAWGEMADSSVYYGLCTNRELSPPCDIVVPNNLYELAVNSIFCLEPAGDTLTRSHLYVAIQSGCIPVIIDGGHKNFPNNEKAQWAWRKTKRDQSSRYFDYEEFAMVYSYSDTFNWTNMLEELARIPKADPARIFRMRRRLEEVAPLMSYVTEGNTTDAYQVFSEEMSLLATRQ